MTTVKQIPVLEFGCSELANYLFDDIVIGKLIASKHKQSSFLVHDRQLSGAIGAP